MGKARQLIESHTRNEKAFKKNCSDPSKNAIIMMKRIVRNFGNIFVSKSF
jgi:hypothetical protein